MLLLLGNTFRVLTPDDGEWKHVFIQEESQHLEFLVQSCGQAEIYLSANIITNAVGNSEGYKFLLGNNNNNNTGIELLHHPNETVLASVNVTQVLNCHSMRWFWIYWTKTKICIGSGRRFQKNELLSYYESGLDLFRTVALSPKWQSDHNATWEFMKDAGIPFYL